MTLPDNKILQKPSNEPYLDNKEQLKAIVQELEKDNLVYHTDKGEIILI